jgi:hypothetical protein
MPQERTGKIFLSYRRDDSAGWAQHLAADLSARFGREAIFIDVDTLAPGSDYTDAIDRTLGQSAVVLVVIGPSWLTVADAAGQRRLDDPDDLVRLEVGAALEGQAGVVPVLVGGASMPSTAALPEPLKGLRAGTRSRSRVPAAGTTWRSCAARSIHTCRTPPFAV